MWRASCRHQFHYGKDNMARPGLNLATINRRVSNSKSSIPRLHYSTTATAPPTARSTNFIRHFDTIGVRYLTKKPGDASVGSSRSRSSMMSSPGSEEPSSASAGGNDDNLNRLTLKEKTDHLLFATNPWREREWRLAIQCLRSWAYYQLDNGPQTLLLPYEILIRMTKEASASSDDDLQSIVTIDHLNFVLQRWNFLCTHPKLDTNYRWSATNVLTMMEELIATSNPNNLELDPKSYALIMEGCIKQDPINAYQLCHDIFHQRILKSLESEDKSVFAVSSPNNNNNAYLENVCNCVMEAYLLSNQPFGPKEALSAFENMFLNDGNLQTRSILIHQETLMRALNAMMRIETISVMQAIPIMQKAINRTFEPEREEDTTSTSELSDCRFLNSVLEFCQEMANNTAQQEKAKGSVNIPAMIPLADALMTVVWELAKDRPYLEPNIAAYSCIIHLWALNSHYFPKDAKIAYSYYLEKMIQKNDEEMTDASSVLSSTMNGPQPPSNERIEKFQMTFDNFKKTLNCCVLVINCLKEQRQFGIGNNGRGHDDSNNNRDDETDEGIETLLLSMMNQSDKFANQMQHTHHQKSRSLSVNYSIIARTWAWSGLSTFAREADLMRYIIHELKFGGKGRTGKFARYLRDLINNGNLDKAVTLLEWAAYEYPEEFGESDELVETGTELCHIVVRSILRQQQRKSYKNRNTESEEDDETSKRIYNAAKFLIKLTKNYLGGSLLVKPASKSIGLVMLEASNHNDGGKENLIGELWLALQDLQGTNEQDPDFIPDADTLTALCRTNTESIARTGSELHRVLAGAAKAAKNNDDKNDQSSTVAASEALLYFILDSLSKSNDPTAGKRGELILLKMQELYEEGILPSKPTFTIFQKVIDCWVASSSCEEERCGFAAKRAEDILGLAESLAAAGDELMQPSCEGFTSVMTAWGRSHAPDAPEKIQQLLKRMMNLSQEGKFQFQPNEDAYNALLSAYANSGRDDAGRLAQAVFDGAPCQFKGTRLYNALIAAQGGDTNRAEALLHDMHKAYSEGETICKPNTESFNNVLLAWSRSGSPMAAWRADSIFQRMSDLTKKGDLNVRPDGTTFDLVITIVSNEWGADAATKVDHYLELLKEYYASDGPGFITPGVKSYTEAIRAWGSNVDDPRAVLRAKALLDEMHELARAGASTVKPDRNTYLVYLHALSVSSIEDRAELARDALQTMKENKIVIDQDLMSLWQRCLLPMGGLEAYWTIPQEDTAEFPSAMTPNKDGNVSNTFS